MIIRGRNTYDFDACDECSVGDHHVKAGLVAVDLPLSPPAGKKCCCVYFCRQHLAR